MFWSTSCICSENPCAKMQKNTNKWKHNITFYMKNRKKTNNSKFVLKKQTLFWKEAPGNTGPQDFPDFSILRYVWVFCVGFGTFSVIFLHFLQKYRCVPKIGFSADIFIVNSIDISICISIDILLTFLSTFLLAFLVTFLLTFLLTLSLASLSTFLSSFLLTFSLTFILTFWLARRREEEGVDFFLKSNNPTPKGGESMKT